MRRCSSLDNQQGLTLVELVIAIVVIGIAAVALLQSIGALSIANVDPVLRTQNRLLAESMLSEVQSKPFFDFSDDPVINPGTTPTTACPTAETLSGNDRSTWDNICDYNNYDSGSAGPRFSNGNLMPGLGDYRVQVSVDDSVGLALGSLSNQAGCAPQLLLISVTVSGPRGQSLSLDAYRTSYYDEGGSC